MLGEQFVDAMVYQHALSHTTRSHQHHGALHFRLAHQFTEARQIGPARQGAGQGIHPAPRLPPRVLFAQRVKYFVIRDFKHDRPISLFR